MIFPKFVAPHHMDQLSSYGNARSAPPQSAVSRICVHSKLVQC